MKKDLAVILSAISVPNQVARVDNGSDDGPDEAPRKGFRPACFYALGGELCPARA
jgi:hypothetical protein